MPLKAVGVRSLCKHISVDLSLVYGNFLRPIYRFSVRFVLTQTQSNYLLPYSAIFTRRSTKLDFFYRLIENIPL